ncbi:MAG TPA: hypothetical protein VKN76_03070 [Kiloniellaceae bacterium]|nr:hypothetical protein [Kiloniellaceae bacterium]
MVAWTGIVQAAETYTFAGLRWGSSPAQAKKVLKARGFKVSRVVKGPQRELAENGAWGKWVKRDRGKRMVARGKVGGLKTDVELVFGRNNSLQRVIVRWPDWNGTIPHAKRLTKTANAVTKQLEGQYGRSNERRDPFGWIDTARWLPAEDGSRMELIVRGTNGMLFYPGDRTGVRLHFWNARYRKGGAQTAGGGSTPKYGPGHTQNIKAKQRASGKSGGSKASGGLTFGEDR